MRCAALFLYCVFILPGFASAQAWRPPVTDLGSYVPHPTAPHITTPADFQQRTQQQNQAAVDRVDRYYAEKAYREELLREAQADHAAVEQQRREQAEFNARFEALNKPQYETAYRTLQAMLAGQQSADLRRAVFLVESTYLAGQLNYTQFSAELDELVSVCRRLAGPNASPTQRFMALHQLMTDTVRVGYEGEVV